MINLDYRDSRPIYEQIVEGMKKLILKGVLLPDEQLPSVRSLAMDLSTNPNTVQKSYAELERQGYIYTVKGRGNFVSGDRDLRELMKREIIGSIGTLLKEAADLGFDRSEILSELEDSND
ncbi:MAG: GntR family transcriptional regulator [Lachnospiraceae bacterium]|nr:GntR family transcriptional regulator [Lachnospiraceae bacterium]